LILEPLKSSGMSLIKIVAPLEPVPFPRPASNGKRRFNPPRYTQFKDALGLIARRAMGGQAPFSGAVRLRADFYKLKPRQPTSRNWGDVDNHLKAVLDSLNGICYEDDRLIVDVRATLNHGDPLIIITIEEAT